MKTAGRILAFSVFRIVSTYFIPLYHAQTVRASEGFPNRKNPCTKIPPDAVHGLAPPPHSFQNDVRIRAILCRQQSASHARRAGCLCRVREESHLPRALVPFCPLPTVRPPQEARRSLSFPAPIRAGTHTLRTLVSRIFPFP